MLLRNSEFTPKSGITELTTTGKTDNYRENCQLQGKLSTKSVHSKSQGVGEKSQAVGEKSQAVGENSQAVGKKSQVVWFMWDIIPAMWNCSGIFLILPRKGCLPVRPVFYETGKQVSRLTL